MCKLLNRFFRFCCLILCCLPHSSYSDCLPEEPQPLSLLDAISYALKYQAQIKISELNVVAREGIARRSAGPFDPVFDGFINYTHSSQLQSPSLGIKTNRDGRETIAQLSATKRSRLGTLVSFSAEVDQVRNFLRFPRPTNIGTLSFKLEQPLLRNFRWSLDTVNEIAAQLAVSATYFDNLQTISQQILNAIEQYWETVAAQKLLDISLDAENRLGKLTDEIRRLIEGDQLARSDIQEPLEQIAAQELITLQLKQDLYAAIQILKLTIGDIDMCARDSDQLTLSDDFFITKLTAEDLYKMAKPLMDFAIVNRFDIKASNIRQEVARVLLKGATNQALPAVNVNTGVRATDFTNGRHDSLLSPLHMQHPQTDLSIGLSFSMPLHNDSAEGLILQRKAEQLQSIFDTQLITQTTIANLREAVVNQITLLAEVEKTNELVRLNEELIANERTKLREGFSTIFVLLDFENRLTRAFSAQTIASKEYIQNIALIRFLSGTLLSQYDQCIELVDVTTLPYLRGTYE